MTTIRELPSLSDSGLYNACKGVLHIISPQFARNLCINPSFETNHDNWQSGGGGGTLQRVTQPWSGAWALSYSGDHLTYGNTTPLSFLNGQQVAISFYLKNTNILDDEITVELFHSTTVRATWRFTAVSGKWKRFICSTIINHSDSYQFRILGTNLSFLIDAVQVELTNGHSATTYFDGDTTGFYNDSQVPAPQYAWVGKAHASESVRNKNAANGGLPISLQDELGFMIIGVTNGDNPSADNQLVEFHGTDGASLQDIIIPTRQLSIIGRMNAASKEELNIMAARFSAYFSRDTTAYRQPKAFIFQHKNGYNDIGVPLSFSGVITNTQQIPISNALSIQCVITIQMVDPFFYGHNESTSFNVNDSHPATFPISFAYIPEMTTDDTQYSLLAQQIGNLGASDMYAITQDNDGNVYFGGAFTTVNGVAISRLAKYNPKDGTITGLGTFNNRVFAIAISPDGLNMWVGGEFTTINGVAYNRIARYNFASATWSTFGGGAGGGVNGIVNTIAIRGIRQTPTGAGYEYKVFIGGEFTATTAGLNAFRIAYSSQTASTWLQCGTDNGFNSSVFTLAYDNNFDRLFVGGGFSQSSAGTLTLGRICYINHSALSTSVRIVPDFDSTVYTIYINPSDNVLYVGGAFNALSDGRIVQGAATWNGSSWSQMGDTRQYGIDSGTVRDITPWRNGYLLTGFLTNLLQVRNAWFNGSWYFPLPIKTNQNPYVAFASPTGGLYLGIEIRQNTVLSYVENTGTAAASPTWQFYNLALANNDITIGMTGNETQNVQIFYNSMPSLYNEIMKVDTTNGVITSDITSNKTRYVLAGTGITSQRVLPGENCMSVFITFLSPIVTGDFECTVYWKQTFNTIFDGAVAS